MIILANTIDTLEVVLGGAIVTNEMACFVSWRDRDSTTFKPDRSVALTNGVTAVTLLAAPIAGKQKIVDFISIYNKDTVSQTVIIRYDISGTEYIINSVNLGAGERLEYQDGRGFNTYTSTGAIKSSINQGANTPSGSTLTAVVLGSDVINNNAVANTIADVTGLSASFTANKMYYFKFIIYYTAQATTTGSRWGVNASAGLATNLSLISEYSLTTTTTTRNALIQGFDLPAASNASSAATGNNMAIIEGYFKPTANCTFIARFASEILSSAITAKAGSVLYYQQLD